MREDKAQPRHLISALTAVLLIALAFIAIMRFDALGSIKLACAGVAVYAIVSILHHPRYPARNDPFSVFVVIKVIGPAHACDQKC